MYLTFFSTLLPFSLRLLLSCLRTHDANEVFKTKTWLTTWSLFEQMVFLSLSRLYSLFPIFIIMHGPWTFIHINTYSFINNSTFALWVTFLHIFFFCRALIATSWENNDNEKEKRMHHTTLIHAYYNLMWISMFQLTLRC